MMHEASDCGDVKLLRRASHTLKSTSSMLGAMRLASLCMKVEAMCNAGSTAGVHEYLAQAEAEFMRVRPELDAARQPTGA